MTDRSVHDGASAAPLNHRNSREGTRKRGRKPGIVQYFKEAYSPSRPDPWLNRKFAVGLLFAIAGWCFYVVVGRVCIPVFRGTSTSRFSVATAAGVLAGYVVIFLFLAWSYIRIITTGPGRAIDRVEQTAAPNENHTPFPQQPLQPLPAGDHQSNMLLNGIAPQPGLPSTYDGETAQRRTSDEEEGGAAREVSEFAPAINALHTVLSRQDPPDHHSSSGTLTSQTPQPVVAVGAKRKIPEWQTVERPLPYLHRGPRWCRFCQINKPDRTHHCRHCGTCILQFDHHCPWIGQCVGWANHKFFMTFNFWAIIYWFYHLILLVVYLTQAEVDGQVIGVVALSGLFGIFCFMMLLQHAYLILTGKSTVESFSGRDQQESETRHLNVVFGFWSHRKAKSLVRKKWKEDFGGTAVDERWQAGSRMDMWNREMGEKWYGWICRPLGDGMHFPSNPRFGPNGEWLKKKDWPKGVE